jgi:membrane protease YdiL (CAAX protease family)
VNVGSVTAESGRAPIRLRLALTGALHMQGQTLRRNWLAAICFAITQCVVAWRLPAQEHLQFAFYVVAVWLGAFITDVVVLAFPSPAIGFPIRQPKAQEVLVALVFTGLAFIPLMVRFGPHWPLHQPVERLIYAAGLLLFGFFIGMACVYLFVYRYKLSELGFNVRYWYLALLMHVVFGFITLTVAPEKSHWISWFHSNGVWSVLIIGVLQAAIPEEFLRAILMTRIGALVRNNGLGLFVATFLWASLHIPSFWSQAPHWTFWEALVSPWSIIPIGMLWGYVTYRTKSLCPTVLLHGFNLWGLQNL